LLSPPQFGTQVNLGDSQPFSFPFSTCFPGLSPGSNFLFCNSPGSILNCSSPRSLVFDVAPLRFLEELASSFSLLYFLRFLCDFRSEFRRRSSVRRVLVSFHLPRCFAFLARHKMASPSGPLVWRLSVWVSTLQPPRPVFPPLNWCDASRSPPSLVS